MVPQEQDCGGGTKGRLTWLFLPLAIGGTLALYGALGGWTDMLGPRKEEELSL